MEEIKRINKESISNRIVVTRQLFLKGLSFVYLIAFIGLYGQIQGLWGDEGIFPVKNYLMKLKEAQKNKANFLNFPILPFLLERIPFSFSSSFAFYGVKFGSSSENLLYILCLIGIALSLLILLNIRYFNNSFGYGVLWYCYLHFFYLGQNATKGEWDILLLEAGFIAIFFSPTSYHKKINTITVIDNIAFYFLRFLLFKVMFSIGSGIMTSGDSYWLSFNGLNFYFQSIPLLSSYSYKAHFIKDTFKKLLSAIGYSITLYLPFGYFLIWRRINIFCGEMTFFFILFFIITTNYGFYPLLLIVINLVNFDDYFWRGIFNESFLLFIGINDLGTIVKESEKEKAIQEEKNAIEEEKIQKEKEKLSEQLKNAKTEDEKKKINNEIQELFKNKKWNFDEFDEDGPKIEESLESGTSLIKEIFVFSNFYSIFMLVLCFWQFPLKYLLDGKILLHSSTAKDGEGVLSIFMIYLFIYFLVVIFYNLSISLRSTIISTFSILPMTVKDAENNLNNKNKKNKWVSVIKNIFIYTSKVGKYIFIILIFTLYFIGGVHQFFLGIGINLVSEENKENYNLPFEEKDTGSLLKIGIGLSQLIFQRFFAYGSYGNIQKELVGINGRNELIFEYLPQFESKWEEIEFIYKIGKKAKPKFLFFYLPRLDMLMYSAAQSNDIDSDPYITFFLGKILEKNPVTLDLLNYDVEGKKLLYSISMFENLKRLYLGREKKLLNKSVKKVKIDLFLYKYNDNPKYGIMRRKRYKEYLGNIEKYALTEIFKKYELPEINEKRKIYFSPFQFIPIVDLILISILLYKLI